MDLHQHRTAILIACKDGEGTIAEAVRSAVGQADVYVVSDGSTDRTAEVAADAGARVLTRAVGGGKPDALRAGAEAFGLAERYEYIAVLDDDTRLAPDYVEKTTAVLDAKETVAAASGRIDSLWDHRRRWNVLIAMRAFTYWSYQATIKRGQNLLRVVNVICGANTVFRAQIFGDLIHHDAPYAIDDMYWLAEIVRQRLGHIAYVHDARSWTMDPHRFSDWYRQTVRWSWGQFQSIRGHHLGMPIRRREHGRGFRISWFDTAYLAQIFDWIPYMLEPLAIPLLAVLTRGWVDPYWFVVLYFASTGTWIVIGAIALRKPRLILMAPAIVALDMVYRATMFHAFAKAIFTPRIETCAWKSPTRFELEDSTHP
jgi:poly-beta-1,6-N-acetyl-D-glucosamine synthase